ncbi:MAG: hypothetical protein UY77_C0029G0003 [Candidatus Uhrbacteria bacterium GW2011_GWA2_53_10]|uniref:Uncharacterized protein n=1 Tax=Candidatus Uhrbacteria bacterium GW2011_GWA2_53_10 TaxID=1618980 RepID=A0A0G1ZVB9_9BACT|nr:MAG: hypothetical protein UY77_C0029G0003 [Candidatus Uhrbacteria bacterium GW2011_GWA2_53_10]
MREGVQDRFDKSAQGKLEKNKGKEREPESYFWGFVIAKKKDKQSENTADVEKKFTIQQKNESMFAGALYFSVYEFVHNGGEGSPAEGIRKSVDEIIDDDPHRVPQDRDGSGAEEGADHPQRQNQEVIAMTHEFTDRVHDRNRQQSHDKVNGPYRFFRADETKDEHKWNDAFHPANRSMNHFYPSPTPPESRRLGGTSRQGPETNQW